MGIKNRTHCKDCETELDITNSVYQGIRRSARCHDCFRKYNNEWYKNRHEANPELYKEYKNYLINYNYTKKYGLTTEQYNKLVELQLGGCAICKQPCKVKDKLSVDHNHETNKIRGLLCQNCNVALGLLKEDENIIWNLLDYLKEDGIIKQKTLNDIFHVKE